MTFCFVHWPAKFGDRLRIFYHIRCLWHDCVLCVWRKKLINWNWNLYDIYFVKLQHCKPLICLMYCLWNFSTYQLTSMCIGINIVKKCKHEKFSIYLVLTREINSPSALYRDCRNLTKNETELIENCRTKTLIEPLLKIFLWYQNLWDRSITNPCTIHKVGII